MANRDNELDHYLNSLVLESHSIYSRCFYIRRFR